MRLLAGHLGDIVERVEAVDLLLDGLDPLGRVEPALALGIEFRCGGRDGLVQRIARSTGLSLDLVANIVTDRDV
ncbi:MAG: hypothetical protein ACFHWZ_05215 [Phycisphaerales bacterium]